MKTKFLLPMIAMIFAIGMSFAMDNLDDPNSDYVYLGNNSWQAIDEQNCILGSETCRVQFGEGGPIYDVYNAMSLSSKKKNTTNKPRVIPQ